MIHSFEVAITHTSFTTESFLGAGIFITLIALLLVYKDDIVEFLKPASEWMYKCVQ
jgi:hypothetical protein